MLELDRCFIGHILGRVNRAQVGIVHGQRTVHFGTKRFRHLNGLLDLGQRIVETPFAEI